MDYQITIKMPFEAMDDIEARERAKKLFENISESIKQENTEKKLQRVFKNKPPEKVEFKQ